MILPCYQWGHCLVAPEGHPILTKRTYQLATLTKWPLITYDSAFAGRSRISKAFERAQLEPEFHRIGRDRRRRDQDLCRSGAGAGHHLQMARDRIRDAGNMSVAHLFGSNTTRIGLRRGTYLRQFEYDFIGLFASHLTRKAIEMAMAHSGADDAYQL